MSTPLLGPSNADHFRVKVGRYGDRWYTDPLPACPLAEASDWQGPSISAVKPPFANKYVPMKAIADMPDSEWQRLSSVTVDARYEAVKAHDKEVARVNMSRGGLVHEWAEDLLHGRAMRMPIGYDTPVVEQATQFQDALQVFFHAHQPELVAAEVVCLHRSLNGVGYGGTADAFVRIGGDVWVVDWKSRLSDHGAYLEEAAQGGGYAGAEYMIATGSDGQPARMPVPEVAGILIVSIRPDGFRAFPIDRAGAVRAFAAMHQWWVEQREFVDAKVIGKPWAPKGARPNTIDDLRDRINALILAGHEDAMRLAWPPGVPSLASGEPTAEQLAALTAAVVKVEAEHAMPFTTVAEPPERPAPTPDPTPAAVLDDGAFLDAGDVTALRARMTALPENMQIQLAMIATEAHEVGRSISVQAKPCVRRWELARALVRWAEAGGDMDNLAGALAALSTVEQVQAATDTLGSLLSLFTIEQARNLHDTFDHQVAA